MVVVGGPGYSVVDGRSIAVAGAGASAGGASAGGASAGGGGLMGMCYERYEDGSTQSITYAGAGRGDLETKMVTVGVGQGSYKAVETPNYSYRPRWPVICSCCCFGLLLILLPLLFLFCEVRSFFTGEICGDPGQYDACKDRCSLANFREFEQSFCCAECPERIPALGFQCSAPQPAEVHDVVRRHYNTVYHAIPENHYVKVQMPPQPPLIRTVHMMTPPRTYHCASDIGSQPDPDWSNRHVRWCCYKYKEWCPHTVVDKDYYHTVTKVARVRVPVPEPMPTHAPIVRTIHRTYHVPSPPNYVHVHVPGPTVVKPVVVHDRVPVPFHEPPKVIDVKKPYPVHVKGPDHFVKVPVPSPPHVVTQYHTKWNTVIDQTYDCHNGLEDWGHLWSHSKKSWCCDHQDVGCGHWEKVVHVVQTYDCHAGFKNWFHGWSGAKKEWCCAHKSRGCPGDFHGHWQHHIKVHVEQHGVGHGGYDCEAGAHNWIQGWSAHKKDWCCHKGHSQYCVQFHCHGAHGNVASWSSDQRDFCCKTFQLGCPHTTLSPLGCDAQCVIKGQARTCSERMDWTQKHVFGSEKENACNLAYSKVQVECDVCRACSIEAAGCGKQGKGLEPFDCHAALGNFCRAWSPAKKVWCCNNKQKGCQSPDTPPACDAGAGKVWHKVMISGHWSWEAVMSGAVSVGHAYNCQEGLSNWEAGWSGDKKGWCCSHQQIGCPGYKYHGANAQKHVVVTHKFVAGGSSGSMSGGHSWSSSSGHSWSSGHHVHHVHHYHSHGH